MNETSANLVGVARHAPEICTFVMPVFLTDSGCAVHQCVDDGGRVIALKPISLGKEFISSETRCVIRVGELALVGFETEPGHFVVGAPSAVLRQLSALRRLSLTSSHIGARTWAAIKRMEEREAGRDSVADVAHEGIWAFTENLVQAVSLTLDTAELQKRLGAPVLADSAVDACRRASVALDSVEALIVIGRGLTDGSLDLKNWPSRVGEQLDLARYLLQLVPDASERARLQERFDQLESSGAKETVTAAVRRGATRGVQERRGEVDTGHPAARIINRYRNKKLYDTVERRYITLADIRRLIIDRIDFVVVDRASQEDFTRGIVLQVIVEQELSGGPLLSRDFLWQVVRSYGGAMQGMIGSYLEQSLKLFASQARDSRSLIKSLGDPAAAEAVNHLAQRNYQRWRSVQDEIYRTLMDAAARGRIADDERTTANPNLRSRKD